MTPERREELREWLRQWGIYGPDKAGGAISEWRPFPVDDMSDEELLAVVKKIASQGAR